MADVTPQQVNVGDLNLAQLAEVKKQLEEELNHLTNSFGQLKSAQAKFKLCIENVKELKETKGKSKAILVPLTNSLYVPGKMKDTESVIVDIGTGYYVQKSLPEAAKHYAHKADYLTVNLSKLDETIAKKRENMNMLVQVMQTKLQEEAGKAKET